MAAVDAGQRPLRVLVISLGRRGGVTEYGRLMTLALARRCEVAVVSSVFAENADGWSDLPGPHLQIETFGSLAGMLLSYLSFGKLARIRRFAEQFEPDVVYYPGGHAWKPLLHLLLPGHPVTVLTVHDPELHAGEDSLFHRAFSAVNRWWTNGYVLLNRTQAERFAKAHRLDPSRVAVIPHGIFDRHVGQDLSLDAHPELAAMKLRPRGYLLFVGRIVAYKGLAVLLRAYQKAASALELPLVIAGSGQLSDEEKGLLAMSDPPKVLVVNRWLMDEETSALVANARFVVLPYIDTTQSGVIPLASALGVPSIASRLGGLAEQVVDGKTGLLFAAGDSDELSLVLAQAAVMSEDSWSHMSATCKQHANAEWGWDGLAERLLAFLSSLHYEAAKSRR